jgi:hypothetical protein
MTDESLADVSSGHDLFSPRGGAPRAACGAGANCR